MYGISRDRSAGGLNFAGEILTKESDRLEDNTVIPDKQYRPCISISARCWSASSSKLPRREFSRSKGGNRDDGDT